jgi:hypothetical protein
MKKKMTDVAMDANRRNAAKSTGPKTFTNTRNNAVKHGLLAKALVFQTDEEKKRFHDLIAEIHRDFQPIGWVERALVEEIGVSYWLLAQTYARVISEQQNRQRAATAVLDVVSRNCHDEQVPFLREKDGSISATQPVWDCDQLLVRQATHDSEQENTSVLESKTSNVDAFQIEAKLTTSLDTQLRYHASLKRDYYRAVRMLLQLREAGAE